MTKATEIMQATMKGLTGMYPGYGIVLLIMDPGSEEGRRTNYVSNCDRADMLAALKEITARFEGRVQEGGGKQ